ncbi:MAG: cyclopropane-fatty-acyl-phospholipid synthase family protein, partial [Woeseiaceae bacterium]
TVSVESPDAFIDSQTPNWVDRLARRIVRGRLALIQKGEIRVIENGDEETFGRIVEDFPVAVVIKINSPSFYSEIAFGGSVGSGEAYIRGYWECSELESLVQILLRNRGVLDQLDSGMAVVRRPLQKLLHWLNKNTRRGSRRNIAAHYDLGNDFYKLWLDKQMMYSSAYFPSAATSLEEAAVAKLDRICKKLNLSASDSVIEIGTGWGGFAIHAATNYGCHVTTTTISAQQYDYAKARVVALGLADRITLLKRDYRDLEGQYDKLVSIEMIEAVGHEYLDTFFEKCASLLKPEGEMLLQAITITDQRYEKAKKTVDFIKRYVFPGGFLPSLTAMTTSMTRVTQLRAIAVEDIGPHYALALRHWRERFFGKLVEVRKQGFSDEFIRMWEFYLCYCEGAFVERAIGTVQLHAIGAEARPAAIGAH